MNLEPCPRFSFRRGGLVAGLALRFVLLPTSFLEAQQTGSVTGTVTDAPGLSHGSAGLAELRHRRSRLDHQDPRKRHDQPE